MDAMSFHVVFPGDADGCNCDFTLPFYRPYYDIHVHGCDCFHIIGIEGDGRVIPKCRDEWPCQGDMDGCLTDTYSCFYFYAPQTTKLIVASN